MRIIASNKIKLKTNESDDYTVLHYEDFFREGHRIDNDDWMNLLKYLGYEVEYKEVLDEEMERMIRGEIIDEDSSCSCECLEDFCFEEEWM